MTTGIKCFKIFIGVALIIIFNFPRITIGSYWKSDEDDDNTQCPKVKAIRDFDVSEVRFFYFIYCLFESNNNNNNNGNNK